MNREALREVKEEAFRMVAELAANGMRENAAYEMSYVQAATDLVCNLEAQCEQEKEEQDIRKHNREILQRTLIFLGEYKEMLEGLQEKKEVKIEENVVPGRLFAVKKCINELNDMKKEL